MIERPAFAADFHRVKWSKLFFLIAMVGAIGLLGIAGRTTLSTSFLPKTPTATSDQTWVCPMHPDVISDKPGTCPKCTMTLVRGSAAATSEYTLELTTSPAAVNAGSPFRMTLRVKQPGWQAVVKDFETVHERRYHLFVISEDLTEFQHIHPAQGLDGAWAIDVTVPKAGRYRVLSDFLPTGGNPQFLSRTLTTADFTGDDKSQAAHLTEDKDLTRTVGSITAHVSLQPEKLVAGERGRMTFTLADATTGERVTDLQPYLGAFGHMLMMSEDLTDYVHVHPDASPEALARGAAGPDVQFNGTMSHPGLYRAWTQFLRGSTVITVPFTFRVWPSDGRSAALETTAALQPPTPHSAH
jgi:hypothetical protein